MLENPYEHELAAVDATPAGRGRRARDRRAASTSPIWGELLTTRMLARGGVGVVTDGGIRDVAGIRSLGVPAFAAAVTPRDSFGRALVTGLGRAGHLRRRRRSRPATSCAATRTASSSSRGSSPPRRSPRPRRSSASSGSSRRALARGETAADLYDRYGVL